MFNHRKDCQPGLCFYGSNACPVMLELEERAPLTVTLRVDATVEDLATAIRTGLSYDEQIALIAELDAQNADSEFSRRLIETVDDIKQDLGSGLEEL